MLVLALVAVVEVDAGMVMVLFAVYGVIIFSSFFVFVRVCV